MSDVNERVPVTAAGKKMLVDEVMRLKSVERPRIIKAIEEARAHGDLSENAEYHAAKDEQGQIEARYNHLSDQLNRAEVIAKQTKTPERIIFNVEFSAIELEKDKKITYRIVGDFESDPEKNLLSVNSPIAQAFLGKQAGDEVTVRAPGGEKFFEILELRP
jgi:transcription elongation factor GreA